MRADPSTAMPVPADVVYTKTAQGRLEVAQRGGALGARQRSVLIMVDGRKNVAALAALVPAAQLAPILDELVERGLIAAASMAAADDEGARLAPVKAMLVRTAETYLGPIAAELVRHIGAASDEQQLQRAIGHWHMAMQESKYGRDVVEAQLALVKASLRPAP